MNPDIEIQPKNEQQPRRALPGACVHPKRHIKECLQSTFGSFESDLIIEKPRKSEWREEWRLTVYAKHSHHLF